VALKFFLNNLWGIQFTGS